MCGFEPPVPGSNPGGSTKTFYLMKQRILLVALFSLILCSFAVQAVPAYAQQANQGLVKCDGVNTKCEWEQLQQLFRDILNIMIDTIAVPLGILAIIIGGIMMMLSGGSPDKAKQGKTIFWSAVIGLLLVLATKVIINTILKSLGYTGPLL